MSINFNFKKFIIFIFLSILISFFLYSIPFEILINYYDGMVITEHQFDKLQNNTKISCSFVNNENNKDIYDIDYKLFNLFTITNLKVKVVNDDSLLVGGNSLGFSINTKGLTIFGSNIILTQNGSVNPFENSQLEIGDVILKINDREIDDKQQLLNAVQESGGNQLKLTISRNDKIIECTITPVLDNQTNKYRLGIWIKDNIAGVGTLTYVNQNEYGALGHAITEQNGQPINVSSGNIYECSVVGVNKGKSGKAGELMGLINQENVLGDIQKNNHCGVFGEITNNEFFKNNNKIEFGGQSQALPGKATILSTIAGQQVKEYDIEIVKTNYQSGPEQKSMVIKITDDKLLDKTGGIVQGMSGSPIIQNNKIIGAVTHVFVNDPTRGFGIYIDWMLNQI